jgi:hypothetical protein
MYKLTVLLFLAPLLAGAQHQIEITKSFESYFALKERGEFRDFSAFFPEELVSAVPGPQLEASITQTFENPAFHTLVEQGQVDSISTAVIHEGISYASVHYSFKMTITMNPESDFSMFDFILQSIRNTVPEDQVQADFTNGVIEVHQTGLLYAIRKPSDTWKFMEINPQLLDIARRIIPKEVFAVI